MARVWLITGASSGFGKLTTEEVLANGEIVVAAVRTPSSLDHLTAQYPVDRLIVVKCDVTIKQDIINAFNAAYDKFNRVDVVFNNSGIGVMAEVENEEQDEDTRNIFEVNFWGAGNVMREAVKSFRDRNPAGAGGLLLNNSSVNGHYGGPAMGYYVASKHALEGLTESYANELDPKWNIKISLIELSIFKTEIHEGKLRVFPPPAAYADPSMPAQQFRSAYEADPSPIPYGDPKKAVERIYALSKLESPPLRLPLGKAAVAYIREKWAKFEGEINEYESWSEGLELLK